MKKIYYQVVEKVLPQVYLLYNSFNNKFILLNNVRYEKYKKENILELEQSSNVFRSVEQPKTTRNTQA